MLTAMWNKKPSVQLLACRQNSWQQKIDWTDGLDMEILDWNTISNQFICIGDKVLEDSGTKVMPRCIIYNIIILLLLLLFNRWIIWSFSSLKIRMKSRFNQMGWLDEVAEDSGAFWIVPTYVSEREHVAVSNSLNRWIRWSYSSLKVGIKN